MHRFNLCIYGGELLLNIVSGCYHFRMQELRNITIYGVVRLALGFKRLLR